MPARHLPNLGGWEQHISEFAYEAALNAYDMALTAGGKGGGICQICCISSGR